MTQEDNTTRHVKIMISEANPRLALTIHLNGLHLPLNKWTILAKAGVTTYICKH